MNTPTPEFTVEENADGSVAFKDKSGKVIFKTPSTDEIYAARDKARKLIEKARAYIVLDHPFFASIMLKRPMTEELRIPTAAVSDDGHIFYNPFFIATLTVNQVVFVITHEVLHYASGHGIRRGHRDHKKWNYAGDMWINDTLKQSNIGEFIPGCVDVPGSAAKTVEDLYAQLPPEPPKGKSKGKGKGNGDNGNEGGDGEGNDDPLGDDLDPNSSGKSESEIDAQRKLDVAEAAQVAKMKGKLPGVLAKFASDTVESRVPWFDILERYMTERVKNDYSWARPNRRYLPDYYLPTIDGVGAMGPIVVQVDISGSVSKREIEHYNGHLKRIVEQCRPSKVHILYVDTHVQKHEEFDKPEDMEIRFYSGGGTHMPAGFDYIEKHGIEPEVFVCLTDGYTDFGKAPGFPVIWCISSDVKAPHGENVHFRVE